MEKRRCSRCKQPRPVSEFGRLGLGYQSYCNPCRRLYYLDNRDRWRHSDLKRRYNITLDDYKAMLAAQGGVCAICPATEPGGRGAWHVDHDHACCSTPPACGSCVRGLLCQACNMTLGAARDNPQTLSSAAAYLVRHNQSR